MPRVQGSGRSGVASLLSLLPVLAVVVLAAALFPHRPPATSLPPGSPTIGAAAPDFAATDVQGHVHALREMRGKVVLLSFLEMQTPAGSPGAQPSRAQLTFLKSMDVQYAPKGLVVLLVDGTRLRPAAVVDRAALYNATFSWHLGDLSIICDDQPQSLVSEYGVTALPTTLLIGRDGRIAERWEGVASAPQLARRLQELVGLPVVPK